MKRDFKICTVVEGNTLADLQKNLQAAQKSSEMVEIRADYIKGLKKDDVQKLIPGVKVTSIFTCRSVKEGGKFAGTTAEQAAIYKAAFEAGFSYVDIAVDNPFLAEIDEEQEKRLILSFHDFNRTPSSIDLRGKIERMREFSPAIIKIATMVKTEKDIFTLGEVVRQKRQNEKLVVIGMGKEGRMTRIIFPMLGSYIAYGTVDGEVSPGILTLGELKTIYDILYKS